MCRGGGVGFLLDLDLRGLIGDSAEVCAEEQANASGATQRADKETHPSEVATKGHAARMLRALAKRYCGTVLPEKELNGELTRLRPTRCSTSCAPPRTSVPRWHQLRSR